jgi:hypothetical protein
MTPSKFSTALSIRLGVIPSHLSLRGTKCNCGVIYDTDADSIEHILTCDMSSHRTHTYRHNLVMEAITSTARWYGISVTTEPRCFTYEDKSNKRPDLLFHTQPQCIVTDISLVRTTADLAHEEKSKTEKHSAACNKSNCMFIPFLMYTKGTLGTKAETLIEATSKGPCLLLVGAAFVPPTWAAAVAALINTTVPGSATVTSCDGRSALIAVSAAQLARFKDTSVNASLRLVDLSEAQRLREAAKRDLEASLARAAAGSRRSHSHTTTPA